MTNEELDKLEALAAAATPGPWRSEREDVLDCGENDVATCNRTLDEMGVPIHGEHLANAAFIAAARDAVPALGAEVRRLNAEAAALTETVLGLRAELEAERREVAKLQRLLQHISEESLRATKEASRG